MSNINYTLVELIEVSIKHFSLSLLAKKIGFKTSFFVLET
jgi:hypothetical protein